MRSFDLKKVAKRLSKKADMPAAPGERRWGQRGVEWKRFDPNNPDPQLPAILSQQLNRKSNEFKKTFAPIANAPGGPEIDDSWHGMIFAIYANDTAITPDVIDEIHKNGLGETAEFIKQTGVKITPLDMGRNPEKQIGSDWWFSWYGYAYEDRYPNDVMNVGKPTPPQLRTVSHADDEAHPNGKINVREGDGGFELVINHLDDAGYTPIYWGQSTGSLKKLFRGDLELNKSKVYAPMGPDGDLEPATRPKTKHLPPDQAEAMREKALRFQRDKANLWSIKINNTGVIYLQQGGEMHPLSGEQVINLLKPEVHNERYFKKPGSGEDRPYKYGPYEVTDNLKQQLQNEEEPGSVYNLRKLRNLLEQIKGVDYHTPYEGWKVIIVGPKFSIAQGEGGGIASGKSQFAVPETKAIPGDVSTGDYMSVVRGHKWSVFSTEFNPQRDTRLAASVRARGKASHDEDYDSPQQAIHYVRSLYMSVDPESSGGEDVLSGLERDMVIADQILRRTTGADFQPIDTPQPQQDVVTPEEPVQPEAAPVDENKPPDEVPPFPRTLSMKRIALRKIG